MARASESIRFSDWNCFTPSQTRSVTRVFISLRKSVRGRAMLVAPWSGLLGRTDKAGNPNRVESSFHTRNFSKGIAHEIRHRTQSRSPNGLTRESPALTNKLRMAHAANSRGRTSRKMLAFGATNPPGMRTAPLSSRKSAYGSGDCCFWPSLIALRAIWLRRWLSLKCASLSASSIDTGFFLVISGCLFCSAQISPINIWAKVFAGDGAVCCLLDSWAPLCWNLFPFVDGLCGNWRLVKPTNSREAKNIYCSLNCFHDHIQPQVDFKGKLFLNLRLVVMFYALLDATL